MCGVFPNHQDFHPSNIMIDKGGRPLVIEWTAAHITDFRVDPGWTLLLTAAFVNTDSCNSLLERYEETAGSSVEDIE
ncbi:MAG: phosphotransferase [Candidatus Thorarchaeota archaeon]